jgi:Tfp pilus assembly protein PilF
MYFLLAMLAYIFYSQTSKSKYLYYALASFTLSLLAKAQAVTLPVVLLLIDYFLERKPDLKMFLEKIPFFILSLVFGIIAILAQKAEGAINPVGISVTSSLFYAQYSIWVYLYKLFLPVNLTCLYSYPVTARGGVPFWIYLSPLIVVILLFLILKTWKKYPPACFGLLFFLVVIFPVLQFLPVGQAIVAERYSYIPYFGLFFIIAVLFVQFRGKLISSRGKKFMNYAGIGILVILSLLTFSRTKIWANSVTLWTDVMEKNPACTDAYVNRSYMYIQYKQYDKAIQDCNDGLKLDSNYFKFYLNRGTAYRDLGDFGPALKDFNRAIQKNPKSFDTYLDRGILYTDRFNQYDNGISDFKYFLKFRPSDKNGYYNLAVAYYKKQRLDSALFYCQKTMELDPGFGSAYYICGLVYAVQKDFMKAYECGLKAQSLGFSLDAAMLEDWRQKANLIVPKLN